MKKIIITIVVGLLASVLVGYVYFSNLDTSMQGTDEVAVTEEGETLTLTTDETIKGKNSIMSLFKLGKSMECTFSFSSDGMRGEGTGFFADGNARVDSLYTGTTEAPTASYMISDAKNKVMYTWTLVDGVAQGVKMAIPDEVPEDEANTPDATAMTPSPEGGVTPETDVEYNCKPWNVDNSVFVPPSDVEFMDMTNMQAQMEEMQRSMGGMTIPGM
ncbi:hypothetical protein K2P47_03845 [Patescibacteria group bacterium]|nr:hypothetical protein [Patescibacteria group bacterium]